MKIDKEQVAKKEIAGKRSDGSPVVMIVTHGGLFAFFSKNKKGEIETLGLAPHKAIAAWMSEKKVRDIKWEEGFLKSEEAETDLKKNESNTFKRLRDTLFSSVLIKSEEKSPYYLIYDTKTVTIGIMHKAEIQEELDNKKIYAESYVRNINLNEPVQFISQHKEFSIGR